MNTIVPCAKISQDERQLRNFIKSPSNVGRSSQVLDVRLQARVARFLAATAAHALLHHKTTDDGTLRAYSTSNNSKSRYQQSRFCRDHLSTVVVGYQTLSLSIQKSIKMAPPTANPTTGKTHVAEKVKFHEGSLKPYSHEELGTADDVRS